MGSCNCCEYSEQMKEIKLFDPNRKNEKKLEDKTNDQIEEFQENLLNVKESNSQVINNQEKTNKQLDELILDIKEIKNNENNIELTSKLENIFKNLEESKKNLNIINLGIKKNNEAIDNMFCIKNQSN